MDTLFYDPSLEQLNSFIAKVDAYPVSVKQLLSLAGDIKAPKPVIDFYKTFGLNQIFSDKDDLACRSEQVDIMRREEQEMPRDGLSVPGED